MKKKSTEGKSAKSDVIKPLGLVKAFTRKVISKRAELITWKGTSGPMAENARSIVPVALYKSSVTPAQLEKIKKPWFDFMKTPTWTSIQKISDRPEYKQKEAFFRMCPEVPKIKANGGDFRDVAPEACRRWWESFAEINQSFYAGLEASCKNLKFDSTRGKQLAFLVKKPFRKNLFSYVAMQQREWPDVARKRGGKKQTSLKQFFKRGGWHADGGPSSIFIAMTLDGERELQIEDAHGERCSIHLKPGDFYVSHPSSYWHNVMFAPRARKKPSLTLIMRSAVLKRRLSGGREKADGSRTPGMTYGTKRCFEEISARVHDCIVDMAGKGGFKVM